MRIFLNLTNHALTPEQQETLKQEGFRVLAKEAVFGEEMVAKFKQSPSDFEELIELATETAEKLKKYIENLKEENPDLETFRIHLPIGSPLFQALLFNQLQNQLKEIEDVNVEFAFSHTKRIVEENPETGEKRSIFKFEKFITFTPEDLENLNLNQRKGFRP